MTGFLVVVALGALISFAVMAWWNENVWVRGLARVGVAIAVLGIGLEIINVITAFLPLEPGWFFAMGAGLAFGLALPGIVIYAMPK